MEKFWIFTCTCFILLAPLGLCREVASKPCYRYDLIRCGTKEHKWMFCRHRTPGYKIVNARLDIRFPNEHCRWGRNIENFGLSLNGQNLWTMNFCYGTFLLCLEKDVKEDETTSQNNTTITTMKPEPNATMASSADVTSNDTETKGKLTNATDLLHSIHQGWQTGQQHLDDASESEMSFAMKYWLIYTVVVGGVTIVGFVAFITYLVLYWDSGTYDVNRKRREKSKKARASSRKPSSKYFRTEKHSTSTLLSVEAEPEDSVYAVIPAPDNVAVINELPNTKEEDTDDTNTSRSIDRKEHRIVSISRTISLGETSKESDTTSVIEEDNFNECVSYSGQCSKQETCNENVYTVLKPIRRKTVVITNNKVYKEKRQRAADFRQACRRLSLQNQRVASRACADENPYDRLSHGPRASIPDNTYNHLPLERGHAFKTDL